MTPARGNRRQSHLCRSIGKVRSIVFAVAIALVPVACLDPIEPTPESWPLWITPAVQAVTIQEVKNLYTISVSLRVRNNGERTVYVDLRYRETDKLKDQKWEVAAESAPSDLFRAIEPGQTQQILYVLSYPPGRYPLLENVRGLYRVGLRAFYQSNGTSPIPAQPAYSSPFVLVEND